MQTTQSVVVFSIIAATISFISLIIAIVSCVITVKNYKKSKRLEFFQRRDHLLLKISDLNARNSEAQLISARYEMVAQNFSTLRLTGEQADRINNQITRIKKLQEDVELKAKDWDQIIESLHSTCINLETGAEIERLIALAQGASDNIKRSNEIFLGSLHILESTEPLLRTGVDELQNFEMQLAELDSLAKELSEKAL
jgi:hypothetical protein